MRAIIPTKLLSLTTRNFGSLAIIGGGQVAAGIVNRLAKQAGNLPIDSIAVFDKYKGIGAGMPYDPQATDPEHLINITSFAVSPEFVLWINQNQSDLRKFVGKIIDSRMEEKISKINEDQSLTEAKKEEKTQGAKESYKAIKQSLAKRYLDLNVGCTYHPRVLFGLYSMARFNQSVEALRQAGIRVDLYPGTEVTDLEKIGESTRLGFVDPQTNLPKSISSDSVVIATGRWRAGSSLKSEKSISDVWPIDDFREKLSEIINTETAKREQIGDSNREIKIAVQGASLTAFDAVKTVFRNGIFINNADGELTFAPHPRDREITVDLVSRSGLMPRTQGKKGWINYQKDTLNSDFPQGIEIDQSMIEQLATEQNGKIRLWQVMLMTARALEIGYLTENETAKAKEVRDFEKLILANVKKGSAGEQMLEDPQIDNLFADTKGSALSQLRQFQAMFGLELDGTNYQNIDKEFKNRFLETESIDQLKSSLRLAKSGDVPSGYLMSKDVCDQIDNLSLTPFLTPEESGYFLKNVLRTLNAFTGGSISMTGAEELIAMHQAGVVNFVSLGSRSSEPREENGKIVIADSDGEKMTYDAIISATGYDTNIFRNTSPMIQSMLRRGYFKIDRQEFASNQEDFEEKTKDLEARFGKEGAKNILSLTSRNDDGGYYYSTKDFARDGYRIINGIDSRTLSGIMMSPFCSIASAQEHGEKIADLVVKEMERSSSKSRSEGRG
jgi:uncharacterized NAD(P)/FAD-binding protein YdhS